MPRFPARSLQLSRGPRLPARLQWLSSLRWRLTMAISGVVLLCTAVCVAAAVIFLTQTLTNRETADLNNTLKAVSGFMANQRTDLLGAGTLVANDPDVRRAVPRDDHQALIVTLTPYYADLNADVLDVIDAQGRVVVRMEDTLTSGDSVLALPSVRKALQGQEVVAAEDDLQNREPAGRYALRATVPIRQDDRIIGAVVVGRQLGSTFADRISRALDANINLIAGGLRTGTTLTDHNGLPVTGIEEPRAIVNRIAEGRNSVATVREDGQKALSGIVPLQGSDGHFSAGIEVVRPLGSLDEIIRLLSLLLLLLGAVVVVVGTVLALSISRRLTSRLQILDVAASHIASRAKADEGASATEGLPSPVRADGPLGDLHLVEAVRGTDEIGSLAASFGAMMSALDQHITARAQLYEAAQARVRELTGLAEIARLLTAVPSVDETMDLLGEHVCRLVGCSAVAIWLPGERNLPALHGGHGLPARYAALSNELMASSAESDVETSAQEAIRTGQIIERALPQVTDDLPLRQIALLELLHSRGWESSISVPLHIQRQVTGALTCYSESATPLSPTDRSLLSTIADQVAVAIENSRLAVEAQEKAALEERVQAEGQLREKEAQYRGIFESTSDGVMILTMDGTVIEANPAACRIYGYAYDELIGQTAARLSQTDSLVAIEEVLRQKEVGEPVELSGISIRQDGTLFNRKGRGTIFIYRGEPHILVVVRDVTEEVKAYELLEQRVAERTRELTTLLDISHNVASTFELEPLLGLILDQLKLVADYADAGILELIGDDLLAIGYRGPLPQEEALQLRFPVDPHLPTWPVIKQRETVIIDDVCGDSPHARAYQEAMGEQMETPSGFVRCFLAVPMILGDRAIGALTLSHAEPGFYTERHAALVRAIANQAAIAIENVRLFSQAQEVAVLEERQRLARELHDSVSQALYGIALGAKTAQTLLERDPTRVRDPLEYVLAQAEAGLTEMRALIFELRPEALEREGLVVALGKQAEALRARHSIAVDAELGDEPAVSFAVKEAVYRIAQEALHNTVKHARAQTVDLHMSWSAVGIDLEISDDGAGFDPSSSFPGHLGLRTMRERATRLGGTLQIESAPGTGTQLRVHVPCEALSGRMSVSAR